MYTLRAKIREDRPAVLDVTFASISTALLLHQGNQSPFASLAVCERISRGHGIQNPLAIDHCRRPISGQAECFAVEILADNHGNRRSAHELCCCDGEKDRLFPPQERANGWTGSSQDREALQGEHAISCDWTAAWA